MKIKVYHGSTVSIEHPDCSAGRENLDFGKGFYLTDIREQAETWARRVAERSDTSPMLNVYILDRDTILHNIAVKYLPHTMTNGLTSLWLADRARIRLPISIMLREVLQMIV